MTKGQIISTVGLFILLTIVNSQFSQIPQKLWAYTPSFSSLTILDKLCLNTIIHYSKQINYQFRLLTNQNYTSFIGNMSEITQILKRTQLESDITLKNMIQLTILSQHGGIWLDLQTILLQDFSWLQTLKNQQFINNRIDDPSIVMFYDPWLIDETEKRTQLKIQKLVVAPYYYTWFVAAQMNSSFIKEWKNIYSKYAVTQFNTVQSELQSKGIKAKHYLINQEQFMDWTCRLTVILKQYQLDNQSMQSGRKLAINSFRITAIDAQKTALFLSTQSNNFDHLTVKYYSQIQKNKFQHNFRYMIKITDNIYEQIHSLVDSQYPIVQHFHSSIKLDCDDDKNVPYRHIIKNSIIDSYLLKYSQEQEHIDVFDDVYIRRHCQATFLNIYYQFIVTYLLPLIGLVIYCATARLAIIYFKPNWGIKRSKRAQNKK